MPTPLQILDTLYLRAEQIGEMKDGTSSEQDELVAEAERQLYEVVMALAPENQYPTDSVTSSVRLMGYNQANSEWRAALAQAFNQIGDK